MGNRRLSPEFVPQHEHQNPHSEDLQQQAIYGTKKQHFYISCDCLTLFPSPITLIVDRSNMCSGAIGIRCCLAVMFLGAASGFQEAAQVCKMCMVYSYYMQQNS